MPWLIDAAGLALLVALIAADARWRLAFWRIGQLALFTLLVGVGVLMAWASAALQNGVLIPVSSGLSGIELGPGFPIEEAGVVVLLSYATLAAYGAALRWREWRDALRRDGNSGGPDGPGGPGAPRHPGQHPEARP